MHVEMGEDGLVITDMSRDQCALLVNALKSASDQAFMDDADLRKFYKLMAVLQSDLWDDMTAGKFDFAPYKKQ